MKIVMEIVKCSNGVYDQKRPYTVLLGRTEANNWTKAMAWDQVGLALLDKIKGVLQPDEDVGARRIMVDCDGYWSARTKKREGHPDTVEHKFIIKAFTILNGPSLEAARMRLDAGVVLAEAYKSFEREDLLSAYRMLEGFVASIARCPAPSQALPALSEEVEDAPDEVSNDGPEEAAQRRFREADAARGVAVSEVAEQPKPDAVADQNEKAAEISVEEPEVASGVTDHPEAVEAADEAEDQTFGNEEVDQVTAVEQAGQPDAEADAEAKAEPVVSAAANRPLPGRRPPPPPRRVPGASPAPGM